MSSWRAPGKTAVITGGASGLGLEAGRRYAQAGMNIVMIDRDSAAIETAKSDLNALMSDDADLVAIECDVTDFDAVQKAADTAFKHFGGVHCLMNNAGTGFPVGQPWENRDALVQTLEINLWGVINGSQAFIPRMLETGEAGVVINTGSKQGITRPPGNYAYNLSKVGVLAYTESLAHAFTHLEDCALSAHLLVPGFVYTPLISKHIPQKPPFAWTAEQTVDFMLPCLDRGDFYIICPDNESPREVDEKRMRWSADDIIENRPALSRWHPDHKDAFEAFMTS